MLRASALARPRFVLASRRRFIWRAAAAAAAEVADYESALQVRAQNWPRATITLTRSLAPSLLATYGLRLDARRASDGQRRRRRRSWQSMRVRVTAKVAHWPPARSVRRSGCKQIGGRGRADGRTLGPRRTHGRVVVAAATDATGATDAACNRKLSRLSDGTLRNQCHH